MSWNQSENNIWVAGHRGNPQECPQNTMASFKSAMEAGVDMIELDIQMSADGELVIMHNFTVDETTDGSGRIRDMTREAGLIRNSGEKGFPYLKNFWIWEKNILICITILN